MNYKSIHAAMRTALVAVATTTASLIAAGAASAADAPTGLAVAAIDYTQASCNIDCSARLSWTAPAGSPTAYNVYRRIAANETPTLAGMVAAPTTTFTDTTATVGQTYLYTVTAVDAGGESAESAAVSYRKVENVATTANGTWSKSGAATTWGSFSIANLNDGNVSTADRIEGGGSFTYVFSDNKPIVSRVRVYANEVYNPGSTYQILSGLRNSVSDVVDIRNPSATPDKLTFTSGAWTSYTVHNSFADTAWTGFRYGGGASYPMLCELEAYGYFSASLLGAPSGLATEVVDNEVALSWTAGANAASYKVYRKPDGGAWTAIASGLSGCSYTDATAERGNTYIYRVAAVSAAGDELSSSERSAYLPAGAQVWWNFTNVKSIAYPGAAAWPANPRPHFLSRDRAGTTLLAAMSTDSGALPVMTFDMEALAEGDGELLSRETDAKSWWIYGENAYAPWQDKGLCWKGAAATTDLIFWANGTASGNAVAVVRRADDSEDVFTTLDAEGRAFNFFMNGGLESSADGNYLYSNCGANGEKNKIFKFAINRNDKTLRVVATFTVAGIDTIRNFAVYTVSGSEIAVFGEGNGGGTLGVLDLSTGSSTLMSAPAITGKIMNVKLADTTDGLYLVAQNEDGLVAVYDFDASNKTIALEKTIPAATMKALYGASGSFECRNLEMTADGRYAFVICNGGPDTRLTVIGATIKTVPEEAPLSLTVNADMDSLWQAKLEWANASGVTATGIRVLRAQTGKAGYATLADLPLGTTEYTDTSAVGGVAYTYAVAYVNSFEGTTVAGPVATATCTPWQSLMPYKRQVVSSIAADDFAKVFDGDLATQSSAANFSPNFGLQFAEPVIFGAARMSAIGWAVDDEHNLHRLDGVKLSGGAEGSVSLSGSTITGTSGLTQLALTGSPRDANWFEVISEDQSSAWLYLLLYKYGWYGDLREVEFYGAVPSLKAAALAKTSEAEASVAPVLSANAGTLSWANEPNETVAVVFYRARMAEGPYARVGEVAPGVQTFTDAGAVPGVAYFYRAAFVTEYHGVNLEGVLSDAVANTKPIQGGEEPQTVVMPVENVAARMDDETLTLTWELANDVATGITIKHRVCGGTWTAIATLAGDATTLVTDAVEIGRYNEYRFEVGDGSETVWAADNFAICPLLNKGTRTAIGCTTTTAWDYITAESGSAFTAIYELAGSSPTTLGLTSGTGEGKNINLFLRKTLNSTPAVNVQRHFVYGNTIGLYAYDAAAAQAGYNFVMPLPWTAENNASTRFKFEKKEKTYRLQTAAATGDWTDAASYTFVGADPLGRGPFLVGVQIGDPNLTTLSQIAPIAIKINCQIATQIVVR